MGGIDHGSMAIYAELAMGGNGKTRRGGGGKPPAAWCAATPPRCSAVLTTRRSGAGPLFPRGRRLQRQLAERLIEQDPRQLHAQLEVQRRGSIIPARRQQGIGMLGLELPQAPAIGLE